MLRALLATVAAIILVTVLSLLIVESRAVKEDYYVAHAERMRAIDTSRNDLVAISQGTQSAFQEGRSIPSAIELAFARLAENNSLLQGPADAEPQDELVTAQLGNYDEQLKQFINDGQAFATRQNALAEALRTLQEESPDAVKELRRFNLRIQSQNAFSLAIDVIEFATGQEGSDPSQLRGRIEALRDDATIDAQAPGLVDPFVAAAGAVIVERTASESALAAISNSRINDALWALSDEILNDNRRTVSRAERARLLLSVCAVLLLVGTGYAMLRLQSSYRELNNSNTKLEKVNNSLEERVTARTEELSGAIDDLKESQVQLVQAEKMSSLGELVAGISHEINTPLWYLISNSTVVQERLEAIDEFVEIAEKMITAVKNRDSVKEAVSRGLTDMQRIMQDGMKEDIDEAKDLMQDSIEGLEELTELAQSLKDFSRLDRARHGEFNVNDGLNKTLLIVKNKIKDKVTVHKHYGEVPSIHCSPSQINQVFLNLITNAADAIADSGDIVLHTWEKDGKVGISVADTGSGIPEDVLPKIRDPFFTTKDVGKGTGLGLSIVDQIVTAHDGELSVESEAGKGTTITVILPIAGANATEEGDTNEVPVLKPENKTGADESEGNRDAVPELVTV